MDQHTYHSNHNLSTEKFIFGNPMTPGISKAVVLLGNMANRRSWK